MTAPKRGDRVRVEYEGTYDERCGDGHYVCVAPSHTPYVPACATITVLETVVQVDDVLTADSTEPPMRTSIVADEGAVAQRDPDGWNIAGGQSGCTWASLIRAWGTARVVWVRA